MERSIERNIYLSNTEIEEALALYLERLEAETRTVNSETIDVREGVGRILCRPVFAKISSPNHNASAMDGIMVIAEKTFGARESNPVILKEGEDFLYVNTGGQIKDPYNAVIMIEDISPAAEPAGAVRILAAAAPWQHIRPIGEDIVAGELLLPELHKIRPMDLGMILAGGVTEIEVFSRISVGIMPTGTEITDNYDALEKGKLFDTNSWTFKALAEEMGCLTRRISPVPDEYSTLKEALVALVESCDVVLVNAGSSAGTKDYTAALIEELGEVVLHGLAIRPGKPTVLGLIKGKPVIGIPGYPGSAYLVFEEIAAPVIRALQRDRKTPEIYITAHLSRRIVSSLKYREYIRVKLGKVGERLIATPLNRGAAVTTSLVQADGLLIVPKNSEGFEAGSPAKVSLIKDLRDIENTLVSIGSQDMAMDFLGNLMEKAKGNFHLSSAHVGSMGGLMALKRGEAHLAPTHLLDEETGTYNQSYLDKYLGDKAVLVKGFLRMQGLILPAGNPKNISNVEDLQRPGLQFVNRQKGSGTRVLADYLFKEAGIDGSAISGYEREMTTHMAVAAAVESGSADVGIGAYSAAKVLGLDFIFLANEEYDFAILKEYIETPMVKTFLEVLRGEAFRKVLDDLGGYLH